MTGETLGPASEAGRPDGFPFVRRCGRVALIGVNSAVPTRPFHAGGLVGDGQLARLGRMLAALGREGLMRVVLIHHPPLPGLAAPAKALADAGALAEILGEHGAELVLHGHNHRFMLNTQQGPAGGIPVVGVPSASARSAHGREELARYHLLGFRDGEPIEFVARGLADTDGPVVELGRWRLGGEAAPHPHVRG
jgi:3',5'-cyclic AMP phosphodiesterase CpdA